MTAFEDPAQTARFDGLVDELRAAETEFRQAYARVLDVVAELDAERVGAAAGFGTTARLLTGVLHLSRTEARTRVEQATQFTARRSLIGELLPPALPATAAEVAKGTIGLAQLRILTTTMKRIPPTVTPDEAAQAEQTLADAARRFDPSGLTVIAERLLAHLDPDGPEPDDPPEQVRELRLHTRRDGTLDLNGRFDALGGAKLIEVLDSLGKPRRGPDGLPDPRSKARRDADALLDAVSQVLDDGELPTKGGQRPHLVVTMRLSDLTEGIGTGQLDTGIEISAEQVRRLACDANLVPMVLGTRSEPLDVGRTLRIASPALRAALAQRDHGCAFPGCRRRPRQCQAHHLRHWLDGGITSLDNMCLLCEFHHMMVHRQGWNIRLDPLGKPEFIPPHILDPTGTPLRDPLPE